MTTSNKYLEKVAGALGLSLGKKIAMGAGLGAAVGAATGDPDHKLKSAVGGAAIGGLTAGVFGRKKGLSTLNNAAPKSVAGVTPRYLPGPTNSMNPSVIGSPKTGISPLTSRLKSKGGMP